MSSNASNKSSRNRYAAPIGGVFIILCIVGFFTVVAACFNLTRSILDNSSQKQEYEEMLLPVVMFDPPPFEDPVNLRDTDLLQYSIWATVLGEKRDTYEYDDDLSLVVPSSDVDMTAYHLFGPDVTLKHDSFGDYEISYYYEEATKSYHVPVTTMTGFYIPSVEEIVKKGDVIQLKVGYIPPNNALNVDFSGKGNSEPAPDKYMTYELHKGKDGYYLYAIKDVEGATFLTGSDAVLPDDLLAQSETGDAAMPEDPTVSDPGSSLTEDGSSSDGEESAAENEEETEEESGEGEEESSEAEEQSDSSEDEESEDGSSESVFSGPVEG